MKFRYDKVTEKLILSESSRIEYHQLELWLTRFAKNYRYTPAFKAGVWNGKETYFESGKVNLGLWKECLKASKEIGVKFEIENKEDFPFNKDITLESVDSFCKEYFKNHKVKNKEGNWVNFMPYDYQIETAYKILRNRYCMAEVATSGGKSLIITIVFLYTLKNIKPDARFLLIVPSISLVTQFYEDIMGFNYNEHIIEKWEDKVDFRTGNVDLIKKEVLDYNPCNIRLEEVMSDKPRKYNGPNPPNIFIGCFQSLEKYPKEFFKQFHTVAVDEAHKAKAVTIKKTLKRTVGFAYSRFGVSGTFPEEDTLDILTIQSLLGPPVTKIEASTLVENGKITPLEIKALILNHNDQKIGERLSYARKQGAGAEVFRYEKDIIQNSDKRLNFIKRLVSEKCNNNTLILFHNIEYGKKILDKLSKEIKNKEFYYIDGDIKNVNRDVIKSKMEEPIKEVEYTILNFGDYEIEIESDRKVLLSNGSVKLAKDINIDDDVDDKFIISMLSKK